MEFEVLHRSKKKKFIIAGCFLVVILAAVVIGFTFARYRVARSIPLASGTINYVPYDFSILAMYQLNEDGGYDEITTMPDASSYSINTEKSYCNVNGTKDNNAVLETIDGHHTIANLQVGSKCYVYFDTSFASDPSSTILANKTISTRTFPTTTSTTVTGDTKGTIYQAEDNDGTTYYFAGNPSDNWVYFGGFYWRIIRINGDGTIRLIYQGSAANATGTGTQIQTSAFNSSYNASYYVGLKYSTAQHGTTTNSTILTALNTWYSNNLTSVADKIDTNAGFCGDREMTSGYSWSATPSSNIYYAGYGRLVQNSSNVNPTFKCSNSSDLYTVSGSTKGNKSLSYPIGLITADEVIYAGLAWSSSTTDNYLYTGQYYWTMSPYGFDNSGYAVVFSVTSTGQLSYSDVDWAVPGVRPVINLKADVTLTGSGSSTDPYVVS